MSDENPTSSPSAPTDATASGDATSATDASLLDTSPSDANNPPAPDGVPDACLNCGAERVGPYCHACGQRFRQERLTMRILTRRIIKRLFDLDDGLLYTARRLTVAPGQVEHAYVQGHEKPYVNPFGYLLLVSALSIIAFSLLEGYFVEALVQDLNADGGTLSDDEGMRRLLGPDPDQRFAELFMRGMNQATVYLSLLVCLPFALFLQWFVPGWRATYTYAESFVFSMYSYAHSILLTAVFVYPMILLGNAFMAVSSWIMMGLQATYCAIAARGFHGRSWTTLLMAALAFVMAYFVFFAVFTAILIAFFIAVAAWMGS